MKNKLLLLAVALLTSWSVKAVDVIEEGVDYYIMNVETDQFLGAQNYWGTQGAISTDAGIFQFVPGTTGEGYNIVNTLISVSNKNLGTNLYTDNNGLATVKDDETAGTTKSVDGIWTIEDQGGGIFAFKCVSEWKWENDAWVETPHGYLCKSETPGYRKGFELMFSETLTDACLFRVMTYDQALEYMVDKAQSSNVSFNFLIKNPDFCRNNSTAAWTVSADCTNKNLAGGDNNNMCAESWRSTFTISQIVKDLPAGRYQLSAQGFYQRYEGEDEAPYVFAGDTKVALPVLNGPENSMTTASQAFTAGKYQIDPVRFNLDEKTDLEIGFHSGSNKFWCIWDNIQLMSYSNVAEYGQEMLAEINKTYPIEGLASTDVRNAYDQAYNDFSAFVAGITPGVTTFDDVDAEYAKFTAAETALKASIESWSGYTVVAEKAKTLYTQITSQEGKYNPNTALDALNSYANAAPMEPGSSASGYTFVNGNYEYIKANPTLNDDQIGAEIEFVNSLMNDVKKKSVKDGMDVTFLLVNADFKDTNVGYGWTRQNSGSVNWNIRSGLSGWPVSEAYIPANGSTFDIFQVVEGAPAGLYKVTVNAFHRPAGTWDAETKVPVALYMGTIANPIQNIAKDAIKNDLVWSDEEQKYLDGEIAKNGTNCYFWDGNSAKSDADKEAIWAGNQNPDPEIQAMISGSTSLTGAGKYNSDSQYNESYLIPNGMDGSSIAFSAGRYPMVVYGEVPDEGDGVGTLRIGLKSIEPLNDGAWTLWGGFTLELAGTDPQAMKDLLKGKIDDIKALVPDMSGQPGIAGVVLDSISASTSDAEALYNNPVLQDYEDYKEAYDALEHLIGSANKYLEAFSKLTADLTSLNNMIAAFDADTPEKEIYKTKGVNVATVYGNLPAINSICLTPEDTENEKIWEDEVYGGVPDDVTNDNLADAAASGQDGGYVSTYSQFDAFYKELSFQLGSIYLKVAGTGTAEAPEELTDQLKNAAFESGDQWWGTAWGAINFTAGEMYQNVFDTYQSVFMPAGYYTFQGFAMDRRGAWQDVLDNDADYRFDDRTCLYAKVGDGDTLQTDVANGKFVAQTTDLTSGTGNISTYVSNEVTWYAPNSMEQYRNWMDAKGDFAFGTEISFYVPEPSFASLGFFRRAQEGASWFIADSIKLFYAADANPTTGIVAPTSIEKFGKADGKYLEKNQIFIYLNGKKFNTAGQIVK
ncbi:MAG: hypothetical protein J6X76_01395 [Bacteroidaceae bacterium]|nr:hypothetical protein [Bacteroidaceae bacterium]